MTSRNVRAIWKWKGKILEWTEKGGGQFEMYDLKTKKQWQGKYDPETGKPIDTTWKNRISTAVKYGMRYIPKIILPILYTPFLWEAQLNNYNYHLYNQGGGA